MNFNIPGYVMCTVLIKESHTWGNKQAIKNSNNKVVLLQPNDGYVFVWQVCHLTCDNLV